MADARDVEAEAVLEEILTVDEAVLRAAKAGVYILRRPVFSKLFARRRCKRERKEKRVHRELIEISVRIGGNR